MNVYITIKIKLVIFFLMAHQNEYNINSDVKKDIQSLRRLNSIEKIH
jgi:hypothetical protein